MLDGGRGAASAEWRARVQRIRSIPTLRISASSSLESWVKVTVPSISDGRRPASWMAALTASAANCNSLRPECLENSV
jgi:hypothetical protein